jgi:CDP-diacylglycerol--serine O-phosphatidyltransferase
MVCNRTFLAIKFKDYSIKNNLLKYILIGISVICIIALQWLAIPIIFILYLVFSVFSKVPPAIIKSGDDKTLDVTV